MISATKAKPEPSAAAQMPSREALLNDLFSSFADFSEKAATIFRELSSDEVGAPAAKKKPKGPPRAQKLTGYQIFANGKRKSLKDATPEASFGAIAVQLGQMWKEMGGAERQIYSDQASRISEANMVRNPETGGINVAATIKAHREEGGGGDFAEEPAPSKPAAADSGKAAMDVDAGKVDAGGEGDDGGADGGGDDADEDAANSGEDEDEDASSGTESDEDAPAAGPAGKGTAKAGGAGASSKSRKRPGDEVIVTGPRASTRGSPMKRRARG